MSCEEEDIHFSNIFSIKGSVYPLLIFMEVLLVLYTIVWYKTRGIIKYIMILVPLETFIIYIWSTQLTPKAEEG